MTMKGLPGRNLYVRITVEGKRKYVRVGRIYNHLGVQLDEGMPNPGLFE